MRPEFQIHRRRFLILGPMKCHGCKKESRNGWIVYGPPYKYHGHSATQRFVCRKCQPTKYTVNTYFCELYMTNRPAPPPLPPPPPTYGLRQGPPRPMPLAPPRPKAIERCDDSTSIRGTVATRECPACGHHEVGVRKENGGDFIAFEPGSKLVGYLIPPEK